LRKSGLLREPAIICMWFCSRGQPIPGIRLIYAVMRLREPPRVFLSASGSRRFRSMLPHPVQLFQRKRND